MEMLLYVQSWTPDDGRKDRPKHVECYSKINKFDTLVHLVGFSIEIYDDARPYEGQLSGKYSYAGNRILREGNSKSQFKLYRS